MNKKQLVDAHGVVHEVGAIVSIVGPVALCRHCRSSDRLVGADETGPVTCFSCVSEILREAGR